MRHLLTLTVLATVSLLAAPRVAEACSCMRQSPREAAETADAIFEGRVESVEAAPGDQTAPVHVRIHVTQQWKGVESEEVELTTAANSAMCGYSFEDGQVYLVYATREGSGGLTVSLCSRTALADGADEDRGELGPGTTPVDPTITDPGAPDLPSAPATEETRSPTSRSSSRAGCASCRVTGAPDAGWVLPALLMVPWLRRRR